MKKFFILLISAIFILSACNSNTSNSKQHDFLNVDFGMSADEILKIEGEPYREIPPSSQTNTATYWYEDKTIEGIPNASLLYSVNVENGLSLITVNFHNDYNDDQLYKNDYNSVKENLISKWGEPIEIIENESDFKYLSSWGNKFLSLYKSNDDLVSFQLKVCTSDYLENNAWVTAEWSAE